MENTIRILENKIQASKTTYGIYLKEIEDIETQLEKKGVNINDIEGSIDEIIDKIDEIQRHQKTILAKVNQKIKEIESKQ